MMSRSVCLGILIAALLSGCQTVEQAQQAEARRQMEKRYAEERVLRLQGELDVVSAEQVELRQELERLRMEVRGATVAAQTAQEQARQAEAQRGNGCEQGAEFVEKRVGC